MSEATKPRDRARVAAFTMRGVADIDTTKVSHANAHAPPRPHRPHSLWRRAPGFEPRQPAVGPVSTVLLKLPRTLSAALTTAPMTKQDVTVTHTRKPAAVSDRSPSFEWIPTTVYYEYISSCFFSSRVNDRRRPNPRRPSVTHHGTAGRGKEVHQAGAHASAPAGAAVAASHPRDDAQRACCHIIAA